MVDLFRSFIYQAAGMVLYFQSEGEVYLLLAEHAESKRGWAGFGGGAQS